MEFLTRWGQYLKHRHHDADARKLMTPAAQAYLAQKIAESEQQHDCEIRIYVEGGLPHHYLKREATARERAYVLFGKSGLWDSEDNNGVLIYLLMAEHAIEIVADRGLRRRVSDAQWQRVIAPLQKALKNKDFKTGIDAALGELTPLLTQSFPALADTVPAPLDPQPIETHYGAL